MAFGTCFSCIKYSMFVFNVLLWFLGCSLLAVGGWLLADDNAGRHVIQLHSDGGEGSPGAIVSYSQLTGSSDPATLAYLLIVFGCVIIFIAFIGCCGAVRESRCLLGTFFISLFVVFCTLLGIGIWAFVVRSDVDAHTHELQRLTNRMVRSAVRNYNTDPQSAKFMDRIQERFRCCGADNAAGDYGGRGANRQPPCQVAYQRRSCLPGYFNYVGFEVEEFVRGRLLIVASVSIGIALSLVMGMVIVLLLFCAVKERRWSANP